MPGKDLLDLIILKRGHDRVLIKFNWEGQDDVHAMTIFGQILKEYQPDVTKTGGREGHEALEGFDTDTLQVYYVTGERELLVFGQVKAGNPMAVQKFISIVTFGSNIRAKVSNIIEANTMYNYFKDEINL